MAVNGGVDIFESERKILRLKGLRVKYVMGVENLGKSAGSNGFRQKNERGRGGSRNGFLASFGRQVGHWQELLLTKGDKSIKAV
jgi:hypothetical protein